MNRFRLGGIASLLASVVASLLDPVAFGIDWWEFVFYLLTGVFALLWWRSTW